MGAGTGEVEDFWAGHLARGYWMAAGRPFWEQPHHPQGRPYKTKEEWLDAIRAQAASVVALQANPNAAGQGGLPNMRPDYAYYRAELTEAQRRVLDPIALKQSGLGGTNVGWKYVRDDVLAIIGLGPPIRMKVYAYSGGPNPHEQDAVISGQGLSFPSAGPISSLLLPTVKPDPVAELVADAGETVPAQLDADAGLVSPGQLAVWLVVAFAAWLIFRRLAA